MNEHIDITSVSLETRIPINHPKSPSIIRFGLLFSKGEIEVLLNLWSEYSPERSKGKDCDGLEIQRLLWCFILLRSHDLFGFQPSQNEAMPITVQSRISGSSPIYEFQHIEGPS